ncbi:MAG: hypothetical protein OXC57_09930 [Rhodobacteraceae bacterium]|nr:hypothetical protein [Paracoccaceae bacterium]
MQWHHQCQNGSYGDGRLSQVHDFPGNPERSYPGVWMGRSTSSSGDDRRSVSSMFQPEHGPPPSRHAPQVRGTRREKEP